MAALAGVLVVVAVVVAVIVVPPPGPVLPDRNPLAGRPFYVDPDTTAAQSVREDPATAAQITVLAETPQARWFTEQSATSQVAAEVSRYVAAAEAAGATPVLTLYAIPDRDCGSFSAGGFDTLEEYQAWIREVVLGIAGRHAVVVVEPDALTSTDCLSSAQQRHRTKALRYAVTELAAHPDTAVYLDGGHSRWLPALELAGRLRAAGVERARGFSLNVSNFFTTEEEVAYGDQVAALVPGAHYVVDTSRNGSGPAPDAPLNWCNPPGRSLGPKPTTDTAGAHADAYLWVKHPGESDGECDRGDPVSGRWFAAYAADLAQRHPGE